MANVPTATDANQLEAGLLNQVPILHVKGTHFTIGYCMGRAFKNLAHDHLNHVGYLDELLAAYATVEGRRIYDNCLQHCKNKYPLLVEELEGIAKGAEVPFYKLFLLHIDTIIIPPQHAGALHDSKGTGDNGCSDLLSYDSKRNMLLLGHTEDASAAMKNNMFIIVAQIYDKTGTTKLEHFAAITYAGFLPGATMGFNCHGLYNSNNTLLSPVTFPSRTPILFMNRALLGATTLEESMKIIDGEPDGAADGFNLNLIYAPDPVNMSKTGSLPIPSPIVRSIEVAPNMDGVLSESVYDVHNVEDGSSYAHCNKYIRLKIIETHGRSKSSECRLKAIQEHTKTIPVYDLETMKRILSDQSNAEYPVYRNGKGADQGWTGMVGIFDIPNRKWYIYKERPVDAKPIAVISLDLE